MANLAKLCHLQTVGKTFIVTEINRNLNGDNDHTIQLETDIEMLFNDEVLTAHDITAAKANINKLLIA